MRRRLVPLLALAVLLGGAALRLVYLDADPDYYAWAGYITDEGRWVAHARELALFGRIVNADWLLHLSLAPLFQAISYVVFDLLGVSIWSARLPTAIAGSLILGLFWQLLRRVATAQALLVGLLLLALDVDLIELSRMSVPEMAAMLAQLAVYAVVVARRPTARRMFAAGLLLAAAVAVKATTLPAAIIFSAIVLLQPIEDTALKRRGRNLLVLWAGFLSPLLVALPFLATCCRDQLSAGSLEINLLPHFLKPPGVYSVVSFFFIGSFAPTFNIWAAGICFSLVAWLLRARDAVNPGLLQHFVSSAIWCGLYAPAMLSLDYFPDRYKAHILIPLAINIVTGLTLAEVASQNAAGPAAAGLSRSRRSVILALVALPTAVLWAPSLAGAAAHIGMDTTRLRVQLTCVVIAAILTGWAVRRSTPGSSPPRIFFVFPIVAIIGWMLCVRIGLDESRFWPDPGGGSVAWWSIGVPATALFTVILTSVGRNWSLERWIGLIPAAVLCYAALGAFRIAPAYVAPNYSMKQTSRALGLSLASSAGLVATSNAEGLFNDNALAYRTVVGWTWPTYRPDIMVIVFAFDDPEGLLSREYCLMESYQLHIVAKHEGPAVVRLYRRLSETATAALTGAVEPGRRVEHHEARLDRRLRSEIRR